MVKQMIKAGLENLVPAGLYDIYIRLHCDHVIYVYGDYPSWESACRESEKFGNRYEDKSILEQVVLSTERVRNGQASYEQDGVCFYKQCYNYELLYSLSQLRRKGDYLNVIDFGGALGSIYFRHIKEFQKIGIKWHVVEQENYVNYGKKNIPEIHFSNSVEECIEKDSTNILLLSSVMMYLEAPYEKLEEIISDEIDACIVDRTDFNIDSDRKDRIMCQHVPEEIYKANYPLHIFNEARFKDAFLRKGLSICYEWNCDDCFPEKGKFKMIKTISQKGFYAER